MGLKFHLMYVFSCFFLHSTFSFKEISRCLDILVRVRNKLSSLRLSVHILSIPRSCTKVSSAGPAWRHTQAREARPLFLQMCCLQVSPRGAYDLCAWSLGGLGAAGYPGSDIILRRSWKEPVCLLVYVFLEPLRTSSLLSMDQVIAFCKVQRIRLF